MLMAMGMACIRQTTIEVAVRAASLLHLNRRVADAIPLADQAVDLVDQGVTIREPAVVVDLHMRREHTHPASDGPDMQIVYVADARDLDDVTHELCHVQITW
jgi:hypothetical protein